MNEFVCLRAFVARKLDIRFFYVQLLVIICYQMDKTLCQRFLFGYIV